MAALARAFAGHATHRSPSQARRPAATHPTAPHLADLADEATRQAAAVRNLAQDRWSAWAKDMHPPEHPACCLLVRRPHKIDLHHSPETS
ncbi:hypothetical protein [Nonomuraea sp. JJY05]|uniref:hypothetical protein n=1 Tax=Nonomuraea sp. JJY05 TaxID=3350255 RepID=UPI00373F12B6